MLKNIVADLISKITDEPDSKHSYPETRKWKKVNRQVWYLGNIMKLLFRFLLWTFLDSIVIAMIIGIFQYYDLIIPHIFK